MNKYIFFPLAILVLLTIVSSSADAMRITMKRLVFEGPKRAEVITVINSSDEEKTYRLGWRFMRMTENDNIQPIKNPAEVPADMKKVEEMVRFAPRRFTVPPRSSQQIRFMLRTPADLADGEYRAHFWIRPEASIGKLDSEEKTEEGNAAVATGVKMEMLAGLTTPVIVRKGNLSVNVSVADVAAKDVGDSWDVRYSLLREGTKSVYGNLEFFCDGSSIHHVKGIAIYTEVNRRNLNLRIKKKDNRTSCNSMEIVYTETEDFNGQAGKVLAKGSGPVTK